MCFCALGLDAVVTECSYDKEIVMVLAWMLRGPNAVGART